ncbi:MAG: hypothetical protein IIA09_00835 [Proteobacteria bacterium]|nr:hypothetical protein [Pseudomonadota bacterium]
MSSSIRQVTVLTFAAIFAVIAHTGAAASISKKTANTTNRRDTILVTLYLR